MSGELLLEDPALFSGKNIDPCNIAMEYIELAIKYKTKITIIIKHIMIFLGFYFYVGNC